MEIRKCRQLSVVSCMSESKLFFTNTIVEDNGFRSLPYWLKIIVHHVISIIGRKHF